MTEKRFWRAVRKRWPGHAVRVEASEGGVDPGFPDCILSIGGRGAYVELKVWPEPASVVQIAWHLDARTRGAHAELWSHISEGKVWRGDVETYQKLIEKKKKPFAVSLVMAVKQLMHTLNRE